MQNERQRILQLVENGTISAQEALTLLEALEKKPQAQATPLLENKQEQVQHEEQPAASQQKKWFDFEEDMFDKKDDSSTFDSMQQEISKLGTRFFDILSSTLNRVKDFDIQQVGATQFDQTYTFDALAIQNIAVDLPHGGVTIEPAIDNMITVKCHVKAGLKHDEQHSLHETFVKRFVAQADGDTLRLISDLKMMQVNVTIFLPQKPYGNINMKLLNGAIHLRNTQAENLRLNSYNGNITLHSVSFKRADAESRNGSIEAKHVTGRDLELETMNGRVYVDGIVEDIEAKSLNGHVTVTTKTVFASKIKAETVAGNVEIYVPKNMSLKGKLTSNLGKLDVRLDDVLKEESDNQFLLKSMVIEKEVPQSQKLYIEGHTKAGSILVHYTAVDHPTA